MMAHLLNRSATTCAPQQVISRDDDGTYTVRFRPSKVPGGSVRKKSGVPESDLRHVREGPTKPRLASFLPKAFSKGRPAVDQTQLHPRANESDREMALSAAKVLGTVVAP